MTAQVWTIIGIVIGALLAGLLQLGTAAFNARNARRDRQHVERREVFVKVLMAVESYNTVEPEPDADWGHPPTRESGERFREALTSLQFVAPDDTYEAAQDLYLKATWYSTTKRKIGEGQPQRIDAMTEALSARKRFVGLAKRDLGYKD